MSGHGQRSPDVFTYLDTLAGPSSLIGWYILLLTKINPKPDGPMGIIDKSTSNINAQLIVGMDVHKDSISACVLDAQSHQIFAERRFAATEKAVSEFIRRIRRRYGEPHCCYEASSCGFVLYRQLTELGVCCQVIAPSSTPRSGRDKKKCDRMDARKLAEFYAGGYLTPVEVPDSELEATRALLRARETLVRDLTRAKHHVTRRLQLLGFSYTGGKNWSKRFDLWLKRIIKSELLSENDRLIIETHLGCVEDLSERIRMLESRIEHEATGDRYRECVAILKSFRGVATVTALTLAAELGDIRRFASARQLMAYLGLVPVIHDSGNSQRHGPITKAGNKHARRALVSAAWKYAPRPAVSGALKKRQEQLRAEYAAVVITTSWKCQKRLNKRFHALLRRKPRGVTAVAVARELAGFLWHALSIADNRQVAVST